MEYIHYCYMIPCVYRQRLVILWPDVLEERHEHLPIYVIITVVCENWRNASGWFIQDGTGRNRTRFYLFFEHVQSHLMFLFFPFCFLLFD